MIFSPNSAGLNNPYKFRAYRTGASTTGTGGADTLFTFDNKTFDTSTNYSTSTAKFVAPIPGFYQFNARVSVSAALTQLYIMFFVNGIEYSRGVDVRLTNSNIESSNVSDLIQLSVNDYVQVYSNASASGVGFDNTSAKAFFSGYLVSTT